MDIMARRVVVVQGLNRVMAWHGEVAVVVGEEEGRGWRQCWEMDKGAAVARPLIGVETRVLM